MHGQSSWCWVVRKEVWTQRAGSIAGCAARRMSRSAWPPDAAGGQNAPDRHTISSAVLLDWHQV
ncbi:hypothetical protein BSIN_5001 [Burkholderia singularis]|uniref:Uncharacterized protein n=1 Tax=Burkholderia singularis TaxID=1503053 RepID=A0A238HAG7_9BURK|nr:hypothetical protein BSIN_5001 [Burkholderia singularis]